MSSHASVQEGVTIRGATEGDVPAVLAMIRGMAEYERLTEQMVATEAALRASLFGSAPAAEALVAEDRDGAVGYALFFGTFSTFLARGGLYLEDLFVVPRCRGRGIGRALLAAVARIARERQCGRLEWAVLTWNRPAIEFYERMGAVRLEDWRTYRLAGAALEHVGVD